MNIKLQFRKILIKQLLSSIRVLKVLYKTQIWSRFRRCLLLWWGVIRRHFFWKPFVIVNCDGNHSRSSLFFKKGEFIFWLRNKMRINNLEVIYSNLLSDLFQHQPCSNLVFIDGNLHLEMLSEIPHHDLKHLLNVHLDNHSCKKNTRYIFIAFGFVLDQLKSPPKGQKVAVLLRENFFE